MKAKSAPKKNKAAKTDKKKKDDKAVKAEKAAVKEVVKAKDAGIEYHFHFIDFRSTIFSKKTTRVCALCSATEEGHSSRQEGSATKETRVNFAILYSTHSATPTTNNNNNKSMNDSLSL